MFARLARYEVPPERMDEAIDAFRAAVNDITGLEGLKGGSVLTDAEDGVIIFTDMFGGTPSNISLLFLEKGRVEVVTGVNLPMVVKFASMQRDARDVASLAHVIMEKGSKAIRVASDLLAAEKKAAQG